MKQQAGPVYRHTLMTAKGSTARREGASGFKVCLTEEIDVREGDLRSEKL